jgi:anthranilate/para-aminobenzoate synthase component I
MQVIAELEGVGRGAYTGAMGWLSDATATWT